MHHFRECEALLLDVSFLLKKMECFKLNWLFWCYACLKWWQVATCSYEVQGIKVV